MKIVFWKRPNKMMEIKREGRPSILTEENKALASVSYMRKNGWKITNLGYKIVAEKEEV